MISIKDVAKKAEVSISTVSNVINGNRYVSPELCDKVHKAIKELNYEVDMVARSLKNNKSMIIGVILTSMDRIFIPQVLNGMHQKAEENHYSLLIYTTKDCIEKEKKYLNMLVNSKVDGIILDSVADRNDGEYLNKLSSLTKGKKSIPVVSIERDLSAYGISSIYVDNCLGAVYATSHLISCGCKSIAHISGPDSSEMVYHRSKGFMQAIDENKDKLINYIRVKGDFSPLSGYREINKIFQQNKYIDGIFADNDQMAIGAIKAIRESKMKVAKDIKIVGFDNTFVSSIVKPSLTTIDVPKFRMGLESMDIMCKLINQKKSETLSAELPIKLIVRGSTVGAQNNNWDLEGW